MLRKPTAKGLSCTKTLLAALEDTKLRPDVIHIVGVSEAEFSMDFALLATKLPAGARVVLIGPDMTKAEREELLPDEKPGPSVGEEHGLNISVFTSTYQRYMVHCHKAEAPNFVALFHPGLDIHYFAWYSCLRYWTMANVPVMVSAFAMPEGIGETPQTVNCLLETMVGAGGGVGLWVNEVDNPHSAEDGMFNGGYFVILGSQGTLPITADEMYFPLYQALQKCGHPFAPRVGYLDIGEKAIAESDPQLLAAIAEGALRGARSGDGCDEETATGFAAMVLEQALGEGSGELWKRLKGQDCISRSTCENCGEGFDKEEWHRTLCPAMGLTALHVGDRVCLANLTKVEYNGRVGVLQSFNRVKERWVVRMGDKDALFKPVNLEIIEEPVVSS